MTTHAQTVIVYDCHIYVSFLKITDYMYLSQNVHNICVLLKTLIVRIELLLLLLR